MKKLFILLVLGLILAGCGNQPITVNPANNSETQRQNLESQTCDNIQNSKEKDRCYREIAKLSQDDSFCLSIQRKTIANDCR